MYKMLGADQREYGPFTAEQIRQWIAEGRANGQSLVRLDEGPWKPLSTFAEFSAYVAASVPPLVSSYGAAGPASYDAPAPSNRLAIAGLIFGSLAFVQCCVVFAPLGLIFSGIGYYQASQDPRGRSKGMALAGIILSILGVVIHLTLFKLGVHDQMLERLRQLQR